jgi:pimeloyl-ACP methyl ester carboxylesterase
MASDAAQTVETKTADTPSGPVQYVDVGEGPAVLFVHGSPGGCDQGALMTQFVVEAGFRVVAPSRPGYLDTPLTDDNATPEQQAALELALVDSLGIDDLRLMCWSGGGPSTYLLAARNPERVRAVVAIAAVSTSYTFAHPHEESLLVGRFGTWFMKSLAKHAPKEVVSMMASEEGDLTKEQAKALSEHVWNEPAKRAFVLGLMDTVTGHRKVGLKNDEQQYPEIDDLGLASITAPTLLVHAEADSDVPIDQSEHAAASIPGAELHRVDAGTHISVWTEPSSDEIQARIIEFLRQA